MKYELTDKGSLLRLRELITLHRSPFEKVNPKIFEEEEAVFLYGKLVQTGRKLLEGSSVVGEGKVDEKSVALAREIVTRGIRETNPAAWATYFEHCLIAPELERRIFTEVEKAGALDKLSDASGNDFNQNEANFLIWLHDLSVMVSISYSRKDFIGDRLLLEMGIPKEMISHLPSTRKLMKTAEKMKIDGTKIKEAVGEKPWEEIFTEEQLEIAEVYFASMSPGQRIINLADNLGKRGKNGIFSYQEFVEYLKSQEARYVSRETGWASTDWSTKLGGVETSRRVAGSFLQAYIVDKTIKWMGEIGVDVDRILQGMKDYGPKFIIVARHGEVDNPNNIVYNLDEAMKFEDIIHISEEGERQMSRLGKLINGRHFNVVSVTASNQQRTRESAKAMVGEKTISIGIDERLKDVYAPGPYKKGMTMEDFRKMKGDVYTEEWRDFGHELPEVITQRMETALWAIEKKIGVGETAVLVSHGDAIAFLLNKLESGKVADSHKLREGLYLGKGEAVVYIVSPEGEIFSRYFLIGNEVKKGQIY